jgi:hypothetical protein
MVLISIHPFALRKIFLVIVALLCFSALCFADPVLMVHRYSTSPRQPAGTKATAPALRPEDASVDEPGLGPLGSINPPGNQTELRFMEAAGIELPLVLPSSIFRKKMCELRSTDSQADIAVRPGLPLPGEN